MKGKLLRYSLQCTYHLQACQLVFILAYCIRVLPNAKYRGLSMEPAWAWSTSGLPFDAKLLPHMITQGGSAPQAGNDTRTLH